MDGYSPPTNQNLKDLYKNLKKLQPNKEFDTSAAQLVIFCLTPSSGKFKYAECL